MSEVAIIEQPAIRTLVVGKADIGAYQVAVLHEARAAVAEVEAGIAEAQAGVDAASRAGEGGQLRAWRNRLTRRTNKLAKSRRYLKAVESGYLPIPRLPAVRLEWTERLIPPEALEALAEAKKLGTFEWFGVVDGTDASDWGAPRTRRRRRDPILVGMCNGEPFPIAWWR